MPRSSSSTETLPRFQTFPLKACLIAVMIGLTLGNLSAELRPIEDYLVDPLTETWRWNRIDPAKGTNGPILQIDPGGNLHIAGSGENLILYDGIASSQVPLPDYLKNPITGFHRTSRGHYLLTTFDSVNFFDGQFWRSVADSGLRQRSYKTIVETSDGIVWVGTARGLLRLNPGTGEADFTPLPSAVLSLSEGPNGASLWASMAPFGEIWEHSLKNGEIGEPASAILRHPGLGEVVVSSDLLHASDGRIWYINSNYNLPPRFYDPKQETWQEIDLSEIGGNNWAFSVLETNDGAIWICSRGVLQVLRNHKWKAYRSPEYPISGSHSLLIQDPEGYVYMADADGTIFRIDYARRRGRSFNNLHYQATTARGDLVFISINDEVLILPDGGAEARVHSPEETGLSTPVALRVTRQGHHFLVGGHEGAAAVSIFDGERWNPHYFPTLGMFIDHLGILVRANGEVWVGNAQAEEQFPQFEGGLVIFRPRGKRDYDIEHIKPPDVNFRNWNLEESPAGTVYTSGLGLFANTSQGPLAVDLPDHAEGMWIDQLAVANGGDIWMALWASGVSRRHDGEWTAVNDGLDDRQASAILCLNGQDPVVTTRKGIYRFDGNRWAAYLPALGGLHRGSGQLLQGSDRSLWLNHTHVDWYYRGQRPIPYSEETNLGFRTTHYNPSDLPPKSFWSEAPPLLTRETSIKVKFSGQDAWSKNSTDLLQFSHRLNRGDWSPFSSQKELHLEKLSAGSHTLEVRARNTDFIIEPTPLSMEFSVIIPFWKSAWFIPAVLAILLMLAAVATLFVRQRIRYLLEIERVKMRFFTHLSHEIKTPLTLILAPLERLQNEITDNNHQHYLGLIKSNSQRLLHLVNQLLDYRKIQSNKLAYNAELVDFIPFAQSCINVFQGWAEEKGQDLGFETGLQELVFACDQEIFHKIIDNLVNNAIKYTPRGGRIRLRVRRTHSEADGVQGIIEVEDNGPGVAASERETIFEPFYRTTAAGEMETGTGIGLALVKELVAVINGRIEVFSPVHPDSPDMPGTSIRVTFPLSLESPVAQSPLAHLSPAPLPEGAGTNQEDDSAQEKALLLLIEDNDDLRSFLTEGLSTHYTVAAAANADEGITMAREQIPDLIVSDIMMPGLNGFEVSKILKADPHTCHIPIILLTALRSDEHKRKAYESGADDFITKPLSPETLRLKIRNLLATQMRSRERVRNKFVEEKRITGLSGADQEFLDTVESLVDENLSSEQFQINELAEKTGFSRSVFYRKFKSLAGMTPATYVKSKRLHEAARMLAEGDKTVTEVAYEVGFNDSSYFARVFKEDYECSPSEFVKTRKTRSSSTERNGTSTVTPIGKPPSED